MSILFSFIPFGGSWGCLSHPHYPKHRVTLSGGAVLRPKLFSWFSQRESTLPLPLLGSSSDGVAVGGMCGGVRAGRDRILTRFGPQALWLGHCGTGDI